MTCKEAESLVMPYIRHEIDIQEMEDFLEHIDGCENCREELEIYYMVEERNPAVRFRHRYRPL